MAKVKNDAIDAAMARGEEMLKTKPRATSARYDADHDIMIVELNNGCKFEFPPRYVQGLDQASTDDIADVSILGVGFTLAWDRRDIVITLEGLMAGIFGTKAFMQAEMARKAGSVKSEAKTKAARTNGAKGGRPPACKGDVINAKTTSARKTKVAA